MSNPTQRFSSRVENYVKYRPHYPQEVINHLRETCQLTHESMIADIGSGTGFLTELFLQNGNAVYGVEPNQPMRKAGELFLQNYPHFISIAGTAEETTLPNASIDFIVAGQAFHWFDLEKTKTEFKRILKPQGWVILIWNDRRTDSTPFLVAYEQLLETYGTDYEKVNHKQIDKTILYSFFDSDYRQVSFYNSQNFDFEGLKGRLLSSSYTPEAEDLRYEAMLSQLREIFDTYQIDENVVFEYDTTVYYGRIK
ncbi:class I SAM-dependent methyltransferase [Candidatus Gracilibacteria bacterium]|nr:class I SAM-dependent methyltransferase [Candidatus Gracilibacteria bacterium]NJM86603.1 class I SAM-dependent methyltransferase [Hydrococcus sp. RU_2_2]